MARTQIYLGDEEIELLDRERARTGATRSELIRRAIRSQYRRSSSSEKRAALRKSAGSWRNRPYTGAEYVEAVRTGGPARRRRLGLE